MNALRNESCLTNRVRHVFGLLLASALVLAGSRVVGVGGYTQWYRVQISQ